jgi:hypothetical protein
MPNGELITAVLLVTEENRPVVADALKNGLNTLIANETEQKRSAVAAEIAIFLPLFIDGE